MYYIVARGIPAVPVGTIVLAVGKGADYLLECDGRELDKAEYPELYAAIGQTYRYVGSYDLTPIIEADGSICLDNDAVALWDDTSYDSFQIPDLRSRTVTEAAAAIDCTAVAHKFFEPTT